MIQKINRFYRNETIFDKKLKVFLKLGVFNVKLSHIINLYIKIENGLSK